MSAMEIPAELNWLLRRPTCPACGGYTFGLLEGLEVQQRDGLWTGAGRVRYRCAKHRAGTESEATL